MSATSPTVAQRPAVLIEVAAERWGARPRSGAEGLARPLGYSLALAGALSALIMAAASFVWTDAPSPALARVGVTCASSPMGDVTGCTAEAPARAAGPFSVYSLPIARDLPVVDTTGAI
ncbi:MAG TPA: hypothetical protein VIL65_14500 [Beijerinckiaceae bacterium]|jgi:hypothetical protein